MKVAQGLLATFVLLVTIGASAHGANTTGEIRGRMTGNQVGGNVAALRCNGFPRVRADDILVALVSTTGSQPVYSAPPGWNQIKANVAGGVLKTVSYWKRAVAGDSGPYNWRFSVAQKYAICRLYAFRNVDPVNPVTSFDGQSSLGEQVASITPDPLTATAGAMVLQNWVARPVHESPDPEEFRWRRVPEGMTNNGTMGMATFSTSAANEVLIVDGNAGGPRSITNTGFMATQVIVLGRKP